MSGIITTGSFPKGLWPGLNAIWGLTYEQWDNGAEWKRIFEIETSNKNYEEDVALTGFGLAPVKNEGDSIVFDTMKQAFVSRYQNLTYALGFIVTQEELEDCQYPKVAAQRTKNLAFVMHQTKENVGANVLNRGFNAAYPGGDAKELFSTAHPIENGTFSNTLATPADLSEASLEQAAIDIAGFVDNRGNRIAIMPDQLIVPRQLEFEAQRILNNPNRPETADRDINALYQLNTFPGGIHLNHYLVDPDAWFIITNCPDGVKCFERIAMDFADNNDFTTTNLRYRARARYSFGWTDPRGAYGSPGA